MMNTNATINIIYFNKSQFNFYSMNYSLFKFLLKHQYSLNQINKRKIKT